VGEAAESDIAAAADGGAAGVAKRTPVFHRLPLDVYLDWLASNVIGLASDDPELETPALRLPKQLPTAWLRYGLNAANWKEAVRTISRRFRWLERTASAMRPRLSAVRGGFESAAWVDACPMRARGPAPLIMRASAHRFPPSDPRMPSKKAVGEQLRALLLAQFWLRRRKTARDIPSAAGARVNLG
jgi:hypothetical protein